MFEVALPDRPAHTSQLDCRSAISAMSRPADGMIIGLPAPLRRRPGPFETERAIGHETGPQNEVTVETADAPALLDLPGRLDPPGLPTPGIVGIAAQVRGGVRTRVRRVCRYLDALRGMCQKSKSSCWRNWIGVFDLNS